MIVAQARSPVRYIVCTLFMDDERRLRCLSWLPNRCLLFFNPRNWCKKKGACWFTEALLNWIPIAEQEFAHLLSSLNNIVGLSENVDVLRELKAHGRFFGFDYVLEQQQITRICCWKWLCFGFSMRTRKYVNIQLYGRCKAWTRLNSSLYMDNKNLIKKIKIKNKK
jgi:hypothetical protein